MRAERIGNTLFNFIICAAFGALFWLGLIYVCVNWPSW